MQCPTLGALQFVLPCSSAVQPATLTTSALTGRLRSSSCQEPLASLPLVTATISALPGRLGSSSDQPFLPIFEGEA